MQAKPFISIVSPVYNGELLIQLLVNRLTVVLEEAGNEYEIILVDDGSLDNSKVVLKQLANEFSFLKVVLLSKNYGQHIAIKAGLDFCKGDWVVVMDCDLQDEPEAIVQLLLKTNGGVDAVFAKRKKQHDKWLKKMYSAAFYWLLGLVTNKKFSGSTANFGIYNRSLIIKIVRDKYFHFFFPLAARKHALHFAAIDVEHAIRAAGETGYTFQKALGLAMKIILGNTFIPLISRKKAVIYSVQETINF